MAHDGQEYVLVGYSEYLERRPLKFVEPIPAALICSACGNVSRSTFYLLCGHILCEQCYMSSATTSQCVCPLDNEVSVTDDVTNKKYPAEKLLRRKVRREGGCVRA
ncbi:hypothetical protein HPB48_015262 [Haemaphysalis longicornis]|uniref:RING-type domain-containing protein n=1 Tax=Haemaphysalis longicornis TaxID=44386 RepID=A0A9J6FUG2_HAELO|nr:hypothetical protein HPB48_015262 [Haemaphysalis longicornis]